MHNTFCGISMDTALSLGYSRGGAVRSLLCTLYLPGEYMMLNICWLGLISSSFFCLRTASRSTKKEVFVRNLSAFGFCKHVSPITVMLARIFHAKMCSSYLVRRTRSILDGKPTVIFSGYLCSLPMGIPLRSLHIKSRMCSGRARSVRFRCFSFCSLPVNHFACVA